MFKLRRFGIKLKRSEWKVLRWLLARPASWLVTFGQRILSKKLLLSCEVAMEYLLALTNSPQVRHPTHCHVISVPLAPMSSTCQLHPQSPGVSASYSMPSSSRHSKAES